MIMRKHLELVGIWVWIQSDGILGLDSQVGIHNIYFIQFVGKEPIKYWIENICQEFLLVKVICTMKFPFPIPL